MATWMIVEVVPASTGELPVSLISEAYRASRSGHVTLVLHGTTPAAVDRVLDPVVMDCRRDVRGVSYVSAMDSAAVAAAAGTARFAVGSTDDFRALVATHGASWIARPEAHFTPDADRVDVTGTARRRSASPRLSLAGELGANSR